MEITQNRKYPENLLTSLREIQFICPLCHGSLEILANGYACEICEKKYPLHDGIPDFRVFPDPYLNFQEDHERTEIVLAGLEKYELEKLLEYYWSFSDITPENLRPMYVKSAMLGEQRARRTLEIFDDGDTFDEKITAKRVLEIGSGTGNFLAAAADRYEKIVGIDIAMRWLHLSRRRFMDKGLPIPPLICCCAEFLPFTDNFFDLVMMSSTLEFVCDPPKVFSEAARVMSDEGRLYINSVNRFSLAADPYAHVWGVGFLPRSWQPKYVSWRRGATYKSRTPSYYELAHLVRRDFAESKFALPDISQAALRQFSLFTRLQVYIYRFFKKLPVFSLLLKQIGPGWDVMLRKNRRKAKAH